MLRKIISYDGLDRLTKTTVTAVDNPFDITYTYYTSARSNDTETYKTTQIKNENFGYVSNGTDDSRGYRYAYDRNGNITSISERSSTGSSYSTKLKYYYDYLGQLVREDNKYLNKTITYTYDNGGNIKKREIYSYTTGDLSAATAQQTINYGYDSVWKDKLTSYNGQTITSDAIGNPLTYRDSMSFTWFGRQLKTANIGGTSVSYKYDSDGNRSYKKVGNTVSEYQYLGNKLVYEKKGTTEWAFRYDSNGNLAALTRRTADGASHTYYAVCNSRGDVEELRNSSGAIVARYIYDTWGNTIKVVDKDGVQLTNSSLIALQNPIRYRGYYFDSETGFYYLQSRYYDPEIGRFINADSYVSTGQDIIGYNMFAYCGNNPITRADLSGQLWGIVIGVALVVGLVASLSGCSVKSSSKPEPYKSADDAARAFSEQVYSSSSYIRHEYSTEIYSRTINGETTYNYNPPRAGTPHSASVGNSTPTGTNTVAYAHTHPNSNDFSGADIRAAENLEIDAYVVGPNLELQRYSLSSASTTNLGVISPIALTDAQRSSLVVEFQLSWDAHIAAGCDFNCGSMTWPTP